MTEQEKTAFEKEIREKVAEEKRAIQRKYKKTWRENNRGHIREYNKAYRQARSNAKPIRRIVSIVDGNGKVIATFQSIAEASKKKLVLMVLLSQNVAKGN